MPADFLHKHKDFASLLRIVADQMKVQPVLVEKTTGSCIACTACSSWR